MYCIWVGLAAIHAERKIAWGDGRSGVRGERASKKGRVVPAPPIANLQTASRCAELGPSGRITSRATSCLSRRSRGGRDKDPFPRTPNKVSAQKQLYHPDNAMLCGILHETSRSARVVASRVLVGVGDPADVKDRLFPNRHDGSNCSSSSPAQMTASSSTDGVDQAASDSLKRKADQIDQLDFQRKSSPPYALQRNAATDDRIMYYSTRQRSGRYRRSRCRRAARVGRRRCRPHAAAGRRGRGHRSQEAQEYAAIYPGAFTIRQADPHARSPQAREALPRPPPRCRPIQPLSDASGHACACRSDTVSCEILDYFGAGAHPDPPCRTNFVLTASIDGILKFWKKRPVGVEFVKLYRTHLSPILSVPVSDDGKSCASLGADYGGRTAEGLEVKGSAKVFDVENFGEALSQPGP